MAEKQSSNDKLATRSDYQRGQLDGMVECVQLLREQADDQLKNALALYDKTKLAELPSDVQAAILGRRDSADALWKIYKRRVI